ncbi:hypothetical protein EJ08DRAFT_274788 [Tothia fuscella]|uniref:Fumarylacetoacetase-like C-terminal domain-containing protein n=1 Tax=Tothia fuscella TaxID=1048955 RepID=A0A9P4NPX1_9PEZI|nr:hypothetical protein EJ08DRAFT_274788 [Tothia fuscella]
MRPVWQKLIRFEDEAGQIHFGEPVSTSENHDIGVSSSDLQARIIEFANNADIFDSTGHTEIAETPVKVKKLLGPLTKAEVPIIRCIGLNYAKHIREAGRKPPPYPSLFFKPNTCVHDHGAPIVIPKIAQDEQADYEGELCIIIGKDAKNVPESSALDYVVAYTCGNDVSARKLQRDPALAGGVPQWGFSKGFDTYAPLGPCLVSSELIGDPSTLHMTTKVDGEVRQDTDLSDLIFNCSYLISYLSQGTTLSKGTVIMTGTPGGIVSLTQSTPSCTEYDIGVGFGMNPPTFLKSGNVVEVTISKIGTLRNAVEYET